MEFPLKTKHGTTHMTYPFLLTLEFPCPGQALSMYCPTGGQVGCQSQWEGSQWALEFSRTMSLQLDLHVWRDMPSLPYKPARLRYGAEKKCKCWSFSHVQLFVTPWTIAHQVLFMKFSRQEFWSG